VIHQPVAVDRVHLLISDMAEQVRKVKDRVQILADNCGQPFEKVMKDFDRDYWMDGEESVKYGIVDGVLNKID
jgi:ATP-dependent Clp protease protease subunit